MDNVTLDDLPRVAEEILQNAHPVMAFEGELGAGKTTLIKEICKCLGVENGMSSPTFSLVNTYHNKNNEPVYHFDLYRVRDIDECMDIGFTEYLDSGSYCLIEWPEIAREILEEYEITLIKIMQSEGAFRRIFVVHS